MSDHNYTTTNFAAKDTRISSENLKNCTDRPSDEEILQFRPINLHESDESGVCSPPLWKNSPSPSHPLLGRFCLSPNSRTQAIARGQKELMEMVKNMPESSYELSLKDLVENHHRHGMEFGNFGGTQVQKAGKNQVLQKRALLRSGDDRSNLLVSFERRGLFLKTGFLPFNLESRRVKKSGDSNSWSGRVGVGFERDWWKKKFTGSSDSDSSRVSSSSGTTESGGGGSSRSYGGGQRKKHGFQTGCWPFFQSRSTKSIE